MIPDTRSLAVMLAALAAFSLSSSRAYPQGQPGEEPGDSVVQPEANAEGPVQRPRKMGRLISVSLPITGNADNRVRRMVTRALEDHADMTLILEFKPAGDDAGGGTELGPCMDLARYLTSAEAARARIVAYVPENLIGHAVLVALACDEIMMAPEAKIGRAGLDERTLDALVRAAYVDFSAKLHTIPEPIVLGMLDPAVEVLDVTTADGPREFVLRENLEQLRRMKAVAEKPVVVKPAGVMAEFTGEEARSLGFVSFLASDRADVAMALDLPREALEEDPSLDGEWRPVSVMLRGPIARVDADRACRLIDDQIRQQDVNLIVVWIESQGGDPEASALLAGYLRDLDPADRRTVAYIATEARGDAVLVALACDQIYMQAEAELGGSGVYPMDDEEISIYATTAREIAAVKYRNESLAAALFDPTLSVFKYRRRADGYEDYYSPEEGDALAEGEWDKLAAVTTPGQVLELDASTAVDLGVARGSVNGFEDFKAEYGLPNDPRLLEPGWIDHLVDYLSSPGLSWLLLVIGFTAMYLEAKTPGVGLFTSIAGVAFLLFFWSKFLGGTAQWLEILMFLVGVVFLVVEIFITPGFGVLGLTGGLLVVASVVLASQTFFLPANAYQLGEFRNSLVTVAAAAVGVVVGIAMLRKYLPHTPVFNRVLLNPPQGAEREAIAASEALADYSHLVGRNGTTITQLMPAGKARFGEDLVDVLSSGEFVDRGASVTVVSAHGNRVVVKETNS
jgi:membrane-bound ClpP family serine protease